MAKTDLLAIASPGSRALKNTKYEKYCRLRASAQQRIPAYREAGWETSDDDDAYSNACRLERRPRIKDRIEYLSKQQEDLIAEKRRRIEGQLWAIHESDPGAFWETYTVAKTGMDGRLETDQDGKMLTVRKQRPKLINDLPLESRKLIEDVTVDRNGNVIPKLYSRLQANAELRKMHKIGAQEDRPESDVSRLSDAELIAQLAEQAKALGIEIDLNYSFAQPAPATEIDIQDGPVIDNDDSAPAADPAADQGSGQDRISEQFVARKAARNDKR
jgi:hypothetical protein